MTNTRIAHRTGRRMVLIDIENLVGTPTPTSLQVELVMAALAELVPGFNEAHRVVACSHRAARTVAFACPKGAEQRWRSGPDGADLALLEILATEHVDERFDHVTICSGDGIFAEATARLAQHDVDTTVVALKGHLAARLELATRHVAYLTPAAASAPTGDAA